ncbi:uncharacterized protein L203_101780 [Cryptococcus depauperatus CBS 7841]|uniref:Uncharacterized protein n=1 Tax=Cryptococcus depauperatus CBS 7841 TaxID=1295531 RepID=A0A1E3IGU2_9TREE|nr:hypothetical protein L203_03018 [Cryptococcus depauperatus CBS 7841]
MPGTVLYYSASGEMPSLNSLGEGDWSTHEGLGSGQGEGGDGEGDGFDSGDGQHGGLGGHNGSANGDGKKGHAGRGKKLTLACHFCRRRKLKCDGNKPLCETCAKRGEMCTWDESVRRRGPGKATKERREKAAREAIVAGLVNENSMSVKGLGSVGVNVVGSDENDVHHQGLNPQLAMGHLDQHHHIHQLQHHQGHGVHRHRHDGHEENGHQAHEDEHDEMQHQLHLDIDPTLIALSAVMPGTLADLEVGKGEDDTVSHQQQHQHHDDEERAALDHLDQHHPAPRVVMHSDEEVEISVLHDFSELHRAATTGATTDTDGAVEAGTGIRGKTDIASGHKRPLDEFDEEEDERDKRLRLDEGLPELPQGLPEDLDDVNGRDS